MAWKFGGSVTRACGLVVLAGWVLAAGCERSPGDASGPDGGAESSSQSAEDDAVDRSPELVESDELPADPERVVSLAPNTTEILFELGLGDRVVGVTKHCDHPEEASERPSVGSFASPDFERILAREPDLVVGTVSGGNRAVFERLDGVGVPYVFVRTDTIEETLEGIEAVGEAVGEREAGAALAEQVRRGLKRARRELKGLRAWAVDDPPEVLLVYGHDPLVVAGPGTFGHELLRLVGAKNVLGGAETAFPRLDIEKVIELQPDRILDTAMIEGAGQRDFWAAHEGIEAVEQGRVAYLEDAVVLRPGPRLPEALARFGEALYGEAEAERAPREGGGR